MSDMVLQVDGLHKAFGGVRAVEDVSKCLVQAVHLQEDRKSTRLNSSHT